MKTKQQKKEQLSQLEQVLPKSAITVFTTFAREGEKGLSVAQMQELKRALRALGGQYLIAKRNLLEIALRGLHYDGIDISGMNGSIGLAMDGSDPYATSKKLYVFAKKNQALKLYGAWFEGKALSEEGFAALAQLPSRDELLGRLFGMMKYPLSALAMVLKQIAERPVESSPNL